MLPAAAQLVWRCCILCTASVCAVLRTGCLTQCFAHAAGCMPSAARRIRNTEVLRVACCISHLLASACTLSAVCCMLPVARCLLQAACCLVVSCLVACLLLGARCLLSFSRRLHKTGVLLHAARCPFPGACCLLRCMSLLLAACCLKSGACCLLRGACRLLFAAYCPLHAACCLDGVCYTLCVVKCIFPVACCMSSVAFSVMHVACCQLSVAHFPVVPCTLPLACRLRHCCQSDRVCCALSVVCFPVARPSARVLHGVRCLSPGPTSHLVWYMFCVASRLLDVAKRAFSVASCLLPMPIPFWHVVTLHDA